MDSIRRRQLSGFYQNELRYNILGFWLPRCEDREFGGFVNCYNNSGSELVSYDKYTWSQGRFIWMFSRLACTEAPVFTKEERKEFLRLAGQGARFLMDHCLIAEDDWRCTFLMERDGSPKQVEPGAPLDMSIYADCFAVLGLAMYAFASGEEAPYRFAKKLYLSIADRVEQGTFNTLPYPLSSCYRAHGVPMILSNVTRELYRAALVHDAGSGAELLARLEKYASEVLTDFVDADHKMHEVIRADTGFFDKILGQHMNPGHTIEDVWFLLDAAELCGRADWKKDIFAVAQNAFRFGWDETYGGILHFCGMNGGEPSGDRAGTEKERMTEQLADWDCKLWWVHSESLYSSLRCYFESADESFLQWHDRVFDYTFRTFPNRDREIREWEQIRTRDGRPQDKVVALPVKDPFHITRNLILILELLEKQDGRIL